MNSHGTVPKRLATPSQTGEVCGVLAQCIPGKFSFEDAEAIIGNKSPFMNDVRVVFARHRAELMIERIVELERGNSRTFFGQTFNLTAFEQKLREYGEEKIRRWKSLGMEVHFLPPIAMAQDAEFPGWEVKPQKEYYKWVEQGKIFYCNLEGVLIERPVCQLRGITVLIDTRLKPAYQDGKQMWENDENFLGPIIEKLREQGKFAKYEHGSQFSRFGISANEWEEHLKPASVELLGLQFHQVRLERAIEANVIPQLFPHMPRKDDGKTDTSVWYEEFFQDRDGRLRGGRSDFGGLANVGWSDSGDRWQRESVRPLAVL